VTDVVAIVKVFWNKFTNSLSANPEKLLNKPNKRLNLKEKHLNRSKSIYMDSTSPITMPARDY
jgi:hypothetical protein